LKHGCIPTRKQRIRLKSLGINQDAWLICKDLPDCLVIEHRVTGKTRTLNMKKPSAPTESPQKISQEHCTTEVWTPEQILRNEA